MLPAYPELVLSFSVYFSGTGVALLGGLFKSWCRMYIFSVSNIGLKMFLWRAIAKTRSLSTASHKDENVIYFPNFCKNIKFFQILRKSMVAQVSEAK